jgi:quercetin dioxygenase-like cupin family protein
MTTTRFVTRALAIAALAAFAAGTAAAADMAPPTENKGLKADQLQSVDISKDYAGTDGRVLRMRKVVLEPGGVAAIHSHKDRPSITYILSGTVVEHRDGKATTYSAGQSFPEPTSLNHWLENKGKKPAVWLAIDIFHQ